MREEKKREIGLKGCGSGIVEGRFKRSVLLVARERRIGDVGGEMGFAGMRESSDPCALSSLPLSLSVSGVMEFIFR